MFLFTSVHFDLHFISCTCCLEIVLFWTLKVEKVLETIIGIARDSIESWTPSFHSSIKKMTKLHTIGILLLTFAQPERVSKPLVAFPLNRPTSVIHRRSTTQNVYHQAILKLSLN